MPDTTLAASTPRRRRNRNPKACRTCRLRKVRCDYCQPCSTCVKRHHPHLCSYEARARNAMPETQQDEPATLKSPPQSSILQTPPETDGSNYGITDITALESPPVSPESDHLLTVLDYVAANTKSSCETDAVRHQTTFVGRRAPANIFRALLSYFPGNAILPPFVSVETVFGLSNQPMSRPFASLWNTTARVTMGDILRALPPAEICMKFYRSYQQISQPFYPQLVDPAGFERKFCRLVERLDVERAKPLACMERLATDAPPKELAWFALILAVLAAGCQCSDIDAQEVGERGLHSRMLVACAWECLRVANLSVNPSVEMMQASLVLATVTCNDDNAGVTSGTLALTARQAQGLGLHTRRECPSHPSDCTCPQSVHPLWRALLALDSHLSFAFDRVPVCFVCEEQTQLQSSQTPSQLGFRDAMFYLDCLRMQWQKLGSQDDRKNISTDVVDTFLGRATSLEKIVFGHSSALTRSKSVQSMLEQLMVGVHLDFFQATLHYHAAIPLNITNELRHRHFREMTSKLCAAVTGYLKLRTLTPIARIAWDLIQAAHTSALLLAAFGVALNNTSSWPLLQAMMATSKTTEVEEDLPTPSHAFIASLDSLLRLRLTT